MHTQSPTHPPTHTQRERQKGEGGGLSFQTKGGKQTQTEGGKHTHYIRKKHTRGDNNHSSISLPFLLCFPLVPLLLPHFNNAASLPVFFLLFPSLPPASPFAPNPPPAHLPTHPNTYPLSSSTHPPTLSIVNTSSSFSSSGQQLAQRLEGRGRKVPTEKSKQGRPRSYV